MIAENAYAKKRGDAKITLMKRTNGAGRNRWTADEEDAFQRAMAKHGVGNWRLILDDPEFRYSVRLFTYAIVYYTKVSHIVFVC